MHQPPHWAYHLTGIRPRFLIYKEALFKPWEVNVTKSELLSTLAEQTGLKKTEVTAVMDSLVSTVYKTLKKEKKIKLEGLGILQLRDRKARLARNPRTGEMVKVPAKKVVKLRVTKDMKEAILGK